MTTLKFKGKKTETTELQFSVTYNEKGIIDNIAFTDYDQWSITQRDFYFQRVVLNLFDGLENVLNHAGLKSFFEIDTVPNDLSFKYFWNLYGYTPGKKRAETLWEKTPDEDKTKVLISIKHYKKYLFDHPNIEQAYAETYIHKRRFEDF